MVTRWVLVAACLGAVGCGEAPRVLKKVDAATAGRVAGVVRFGGVAPAARRVTMDAAECAGLHASAVMVEDVAVRDGRLAGAFVWVKSGLEAYEFEVPATPVVMDQVGCMFVPRVIGVRVGQRFVMKNSDPVMHNVHSMPVVNDVYNRGFPGKDVVQETSFGDPEVMVPVRCDLHSWMTGHVGVVAHPFFAVTGADGQFQFEGLPPGEYVLEAWHETLGTARKAIKLGVKESGKIEIVFGP